MSVGIDLWGPTPDDLGDAGPLVPLTWSPVVPDGSLVTGPATIATEWGPVVGAVLSGYLVLTPLTRSAITPDGSLVTGPATLATEWGPVAPEPDDGVLLARVAGQWWAPFVADDYASPPAVEDNAGLRRPRIVSAPLELEPEAWARRHDGALFHTGAEPPPTYRIHRPRVVAAPLELEPEARAWRGHPARHTGEEPPPVPRLHLPRVVAAELELEPEAWARRGLPILHTGKQPLSPAIFVRHFVAAELELEPEPEAWSRREPILRQRPRLVLRARLAVAPDEDVEARAQRVAPHLIDWGTRYHEVRGLYRVFNAAGYRFFRSSSGPPADTDSPWATSSSLPHEPTDTFGDGTWWLSVSYFNGVLDSGFLPVGPAGEPYLLLVVDGGAAASSPPVAPLDVRLEVRAGGVIRVHALYAQAPGAGRADTWVVAYTSNGSDPPADTPTLTQAFRGAAGVEVLTLDLPAQAHGTVVKVRVQVRRAAGPVYSVGSSVLSATADAQGPDAPDALQAWRGPLPEGV